MVNTGASCELIPANVWTILVSPASPNQTRWLLFLLCFVFNGAEWKGICRATVLQSAHSEFSFIKVWECAVVDVRPLTYTLYQRECMAPHSPGAGPGARSRSGTGRAARAGPGRQKRDRAFPIFSQHEAQLHDLVVQHGPKLLKVKKKKKSKNPSVRCR